MASQQRHEEERGTAADTMAVDQTFYTTAIALGGKAWE